MSGVIGQLMAVLGLDTGPYSKGTTKAQLETQKLEKSIASTGAKIAAAGVGMSAAFTAPFLNMMSTAMGAARESAQAIGQVNAALASMGPVAGRTSDQLAKQADSLMRISTFDDDEILRKVTANMLTFGNISGEAFDRAQRAAVDLSARLGQDLQSSAIQLGKALNDPIKGLTALGRVGVSFSQEQKAMIESMVAQGNAAGAQGVILSELERQFGGAAKAMRDATPGADAKNAWDQLQESVGKFGLKLMATVGPALTRLLDSFNNLSPGAQTAIVSFAAVLAAVGPVATVIGGLTTLFAPLIAGLAGGAVGFGALTAAALPWIALAAGIAAIGYAIYDNWDKISPVLDEVGAAIGAALGPTVREIIKAISQTLSEFWNGPAGQAIKGAAADFMAFGAAVARALGPVVLTVVKATLSYMLMIFKQIIDMVKLVYNVFTGDWAAAWNNAKAIVERAFGDLPARVIGFVSGMVNGIRTWLVDRLGDIVSKVAEKLKLVGRLFYELYDEVVGHSTVPDLVDGIKIEFQRLGSDMVDPTIKATKKTAEAFKKLKDDTQGLLDRLFPERAAFRDYENGLKTINDALDKHIIKANIAAEASGRLAREFYGNLETVASSDEYDGLSKTLAQIDADMAKLGQTTAEVFPQMSESTRALGEDINQIVSNGIKGMIRGFGSLKDIALEVLYRIGDAIVDQILTPLLQGGSNGGGIGGAIAGAFGGIFKKTGSIGTPPVAGARAMGGPVLAGKNYLVGERGPELLRMGNQSGSIVSNDNLRAANGGGAVTIRIVENEMFAARVEQISGNQLGQAVPIIIQRSTEQTSAALARKRLG